MKRNDELARKAPKVWLVCANWTHIRPLTTRVRFWDLIFENRFNADIDVDDHSWFLLSL